MKNPRLGRGMFILSPIRAKHRRPAVNPVRRTHQKRPCGGSLWPVCRTKSPAALRCCAPYGLRRAAPQGRTPRNHTAASSRAQRDHRSMLQAPDHAIPKLPPQCVSNSEAASGLLTSSQGTDAPTNLPGTPYSVRLQPRRGMQGWVLRAGGPPPCPKRRLSSPILSSLEKKESGPRRALDYLSGRHWHGKIFKLDFLSLEKSSTALQTCHCVAASSLRCMGSTEPIALRALGV